MELRKLTKENWKELYARPVCCFTESMTCAEELCRIWPLLSQIRYLVDENAKDGEMRSLCGKKMPVYSLRQLSQKDLSCVSLLIADDYYEEAFEKLSQIEAVQRSVNVIYYFEDRETACERVFREKYADSPLQDIIVFRSGPHASSYIEGMDFDDNARALFEYFLAGHYNRRYELVWLVKDPLSFRRYESCSNVTFLSFNWSVSENPGEREAYYRALCLARFLFFTDAYGFARNCRSDQIRVQLWHGCGFKTRVNFVRCEKRYEYMTVNSPLYAGIHERIYGLRSDQLLITGCARQDWLYDPVNGEELKRLQIPERKYLLWLPTFREAKEQFVHLKGYHLASDTGLPVTDTKEKLERLNELLKERNLTLVIKPHPFQKEIPDCTGFSHVELLMQQDLFKADISLNRLMGGAEALISDYSSAAVDFLLLNRPMAFTLVDKEEYKQSRGFVFDPVEPWLPGEFIFCLEDFCVFIENVATGMDTVLQKRRLLYRKMHSYRDAGSCRRIVEALKIESPKEEDLCNLN